MDAPHTVGPVSPAGATGPLDSPVSTTEPGAPGRTTADLTTTGLTTTGQVTADRTTTESEPGPPAERHPAPGAGGGAEPRTLPLRLTVNGERHEVTVDPRTSLLDLLREHLELTGTKVGCDQGTCGACTVQLDGRRVLSCLTLAVTVGDQRVRTIEGLAPDGELHPMQRAFVDHDALQCGYCTPGQIMSAEACVREGHAGSVEEIREYMSGNLCRCSAYPNIVAAIRAAAEEG